MEVSYPEGGYDSCFSVEDHSFWFRERNNIIKYVVAQYSNRGVFLDVGGGNGFVTKALEELSLQIKPVLVEPGKQGCKNAEIRGVKEIHNKALSELQEYHQVENIGLFDVVEHIKDDKSFLSEMHSRLYSGGKLFITVPAYQGLWSMEDIDAGHFRRYSLGSLSKLLEATGFHIEYSSGFFISLIPLIFFFRRIPFKMGIQLSNPERDHKEGLPAQILTKVLRLELKLIKLFGRFNFGASLVICASKKNDEKNHLIRT